MISRIDRPIDPGSIAVVIVTYDAESCVAATIEALLPQLDEADELIVVDNASRDGTLREVEAAAAGARVLQMGSNRGFSAACNAGAAVSEARLLLFLNPDVRVEPGALAALRATAQEQPGWGAWQALVTLPDGRVNTSGGEVHYTGIAWAGQAEAPARPAEVAFASGAALMVRRGSWEELGGFEEAFFMYCEDVDLSLRLRLAGSAVGVVPAARVVHDYEFHKGADKWFFLERNRCWMVLATYPAPLLALLAPALLATEVGLLAVAATGGWLGPKLRADAAVIASLPWVARRRRAVQARPTIASAAFARALTDELRSPYLGRLARFAPLRALLRIYWRVVLTCLRNRP